MSIPFPLCPLVSFPALQFLGSEDEQSPCQAQRHASNAYNVTFETGSQDTASQIRRRQLLKTTGQTQSLGSDGGRGKAVWSGYDIQSALGTARPHVFHENVTELRKFLGPNKRANRLLGGMLLHQIREASVRNSACDIGFPGLSAACGHKMQVDR